VNGHVTFVAARVPGQLVKVLVDDNNRVHKGDLIAQLDREPYQVQVELKEAAVESAEADLLAARVQVRGLAALARSNRFKVQHAIEDVNNKIALLRASVATSESKQATQQRASADLERAQRLLKAGNISREEFDRTQELLRVANAEVKQTLEQVYQVRVSLGLPAQTGEGHDLAEVPADLDQNFSTVRQALAELLQAAAPLGIIPSSYELKPKEVIDEFYQRDPSADLDRIYAKLMSEAPLIKQADAKLLEARSNLDQARLNLRYCDIFAEIDGVVTRRNVNPGNNVQAGQSLMAIRSLTEIWIDANFKETQLADLRIGQRVDLEVDMYGSRRKFEGRITGFTMGTGSTLAILPPQNATGNFIKVVQRLPVRIEPVNYDPAEFPLFIGLSVEPHVYIKEPPTGPDAGKFLQPHSAAPLPDETPRPEGTQDGGAQP
jgi:membrane fusion protein (multidrug efflux system)